MVGEGGGFGHGYDRMILWLAYKEAKAMIGFVAPPPPGRRPTGNDRVTELRFAPRVR